MNDQPENKLIETIEEITENTQRNKGVFVEYTTEAELLDALKLCVNPEIIITEPERILTFNNAPLLWRGGKAFVCGVSKARKTTYLTLITSILCGRNEEARGFKTHQKSYKVLYVDTEQAEYDSQRILFRVAKLCGKNANELPLKVLPLNKKSPQDIRKLMECVIIGYRPDVVILDNWTDCVNSVNDERECTEFSRKLRILAECYNLAIYSVIHANEGTRKDDRPDFRGWAKEESRKSDLTTFLKDEGNYSSVSFRGRQQTPDCFCIGFDDNGLPAFVDPTTTQRKAIKAIKDASLILSDIPQDGITATELTGIIGRKLNIQKRSAYARLAEFKLNGLVFECSGLYFATKQNKQEQEELPF